ncbi:MAG: sigma-70 family RNA polymerase sigma factor [Elusimicrobia bacterium]|nr:sigma-70 family RNA polymerase sigma factor [Elusimicrobiota bacterium]
MAPAAGAPAAGSSPLPARSEKSLFEEVVERCGAKVYALACRLLGSDQGAEDLAQESLVRAFRFYGNFRGESSVDTWLYRITVNTWKNQVRSEKRRRFWQTFSLFGFFGNEEKPVESNMAGSSLLLEDDDRSGMVRQALDKLEPQDRAIVTLRDLEGKSYVEIADILGVPQGTVKSRLSRARESLRRLLI